MSSPPSPPWVEEWSLLAQLTVSSCVLFFCCCSVFILCYDHGTFIIVCFVCWKESIAYCCKFKKETTSYFEGINIFNRKRFPCCKHQCNCWHMHAFGDISFVFSCSTVDKIEKKYFFCLVGTSLQKYSFFLPGKWYSCQGIGIPAREMGCFLGISPASNSTPRIWLTQKEKNFEFPWQKWVWNTFTPLTNCISLA